MRIPLLHATSSMLFFSLLAPFANAAELLQSMELVNSGAILSCNYTVSSNEFLFTCRDGYSVFALRCLADEARSIEPGVDDRRDFVCPVSAAQSVAGNAFRLSCSLYDPTMREYLLDRTTRYPNLLLDGRVPTHNCPSTKTDYRGGHE
jgi:hypothetical protein